jgi:hypothetical protein
MGVDTIKDIEEPFFGIDIVVLAIYNPGIGRFPSVYPLTKKYPS